MKKKIFAAFAALIMVSTLGLTVKGEEEFNGMDCYIYCKPSTELRCVLVYGDGSTFNCFLREPYVMQQ